MAGFGGERQQQRFVGGDMVEDAGQEAGQGGGGAKAGRVEARLRQETVQAIRVGGDKAECFDRQRLGCRAIKSSR